MRTESLLLSLLLFGCVLSTNTIAGGQRSIWFNVGGDVTSGSQLFNIQNAKLHDTSINSYRLNAFNDGAFNLAIDNVAQRFSLFPTGDPETFGSIVEQTFPNSNYTYDYQFYISPILPVARALITFTSTTPVNISVTLNTISGAGGSTLLIGDYSRNSSLDNSDYWIVYGDNSQDSFGRYTGIPFVTLSFFGPGSVESPSLQSQAGGIFSATYQLELEPGVSESLILFTQLSLNPSSALTSASTFASVTDLRKTDLLFGLSSSELDSIVNWGLSNGRKVSSYSGICDFASEIKDRVSRIRTNQRHVYTQPWQC